MQHIMIDIETLGRRNNAVILSIGWCGFLLRPDFKVIVSSQVNIAPQSCVNYGLTTDLDTILWWLDPDKMVALLDTLRNPVSLPEALEKLRLAADWESLNGVWSSSPKFDIGILENAFEACGKSVPWHYRQLRCSRTVSTVVHVTSDVVPSLPIHQRPHVAAEDAVFQARALSANIKALRGV